MPDDLSIHARACQRINDLDPDLSEFIRDSNIQLPFILFLGGDVAAVAEWKDGNLPLLAHVFQNIVRELNIELEKARAAAPMDSFLLYIAIDSTNATEYGVLSQTVYKFNSPGGSA